MAKTTPAEFFRQVNQEARKVAWPTFGEARITSVMVAILCAVMSIFFIVIDQMLNWGIKFILDIGA